MAKIKILNGKQTTDDYPYGRLRCTRHSWIEYKRGKGYRRADQTINPKTGRENKPKRTTYSEYMVLYEEPETGHIKTFFASINGTKSIMRFINFIKDNEEQLIFTEEQSQDLWAGIIASLKIGAQWTKFKIAEEGEKLTAIQFLDAIDLPYMIELYGAKASIKELADYPHDIQAIQEKLEDKDKGQAIKYFAPIKG